jgi:hypothetical protein
MERPQQGEEQQKGDRGGAGDDRENLAEHRSEDVLYHSVMTRG